MKPKSLPPEDIDEDGHNEEDPKKQLKGELEDEFPLKMTQDYYTSKMEYGVSDHKPVIGIFRLEVGHHRVWLKQLSLTLCVIKYYKNDHLLICYQLRKMYETPLVQVCAEGEWSADFDALITYRLLQSFPSSAWDWIGLYKVREVPKMCSVPMGSQTAGKINNGNGKCK